MERTLATDIVAFAEEMYVVDRAWLPDGRVRRNHPIRLLDWQKAQLYDVFPIENGGRPVVRNYLDSENKKLGKSTKGGVVSAFLAATEPNAEVYICAADLQQSKDRVFKSVKYAVEHGPLGNYARARSDWIEFSNGAVIRALPMDYKGASGSEPLCVIFDELHTYTWEKERRLWDEMIVPPTLPYGIRWVASYAGWSGESILLQEVWDKVKAGELVQEWPPVYHNDAAGWWGLITQGEEAYQLVPWTQGERGRRYLEEARGSERLPSYIRLFQNKWSQSENAFCPLQWWERALDPELRPLPPNKEISLHVGIDAAVKPGGDDTAVIAVYRDHLGRVAVAWYQMWKGAGRKRELNLSQTVEPYLERQMRAYKIQQINYDPRFMVNVAQRLRGKGLPMHEVSQTLPILGPLGHNLYTLLQDGKFAYYDDPGLRYAVAGVVAKEVTQGLHIKKGEAQADLVVALSFACGGLPADRSLRIPGFGVGVFVGAIEPDETQREEWRLRTGGGLQPAGYDRRRGWSR